VTILFVLLTASLEECKQTNKQISLSGRFILAENASSVPQVSLDFVMRKLRVLQASHMLHLANRSRFVISVTAQPIYTHRYSMDTGPQLGWTSSWIISLCTRRRLALFCTLAVEVSSAFGSGYLKCSAPEPNEYKSRPRISVDMMAMCQGIPVFQHFNSCHQLHNIYRVILPIPSAIFKI
jgi:hypothetical protein